MNYTDLHCDTALEMQRRHMGLRQNSLHIDMQKAKNFGTYTQVFAIWSDNDREDDDNYADFFAVREHLLENLKENDIALCETGADFRLPRPRRAVLAVEGGKLLSDDIERLGVLRGCGVRFLTLVWNGECKLGGAFNTDVGLTDFGRETVKRCEELGIVVDVSHGSDRLVADVFELAKKPPIASHSSSRAVLSKFCPGKKTPAKRNLTDEQFLEIKRRGGIVGLSLCRGHIADEDGPVTIDDLMGHIDHYMALGGGDTVCFGCDFDGAQIVDGVGDIRGVEKICEALAKSGYSGAAIENIMHKNADKFIMDNI